MEQKGGRELPLLHPSGYASVEYKKTILLMV